MIYNQSSEDMSAIDDESVHLIIGSPPYKVGIDYEGYDDNPSWSSYTMIMHTVLTECYRVLVPGGRIAIVVANLGRKPYIPLSDLFRELLDGAGFTNMGEIIWRKFKTSNSTAWGSYMKASRPMIRDVHEYIVLATKGTDPMNIYDKSDITKEEWAHWTTSIWDIQPETGKQKKGVHPAPFPKELPKRLIKLFTHKGHTVLDPFAGSGTTLWVARDLLRNGIGFEISEKYYEKMRTPAGVQRLEKFWSGWFEKI